MIVAHHRLCAAMKLRESEKGCCVAKEEKGSETDGGLCNKYSDPQAYDLLHGVI